MNSFLAYVPAFFLIFFMSRHNRPNLLRRVPGRTKKSLMQAYLKMVYAHYGRKCAYCGEVEVKFLTLDHVNNDGNISRRRGSNHRRNSNHTYMAIVRDNFPDTYRILCYNCNSGRERNGGICPHTGVLIDGPPVRNGDAVKPVAFLPLLDGCFQ